MLIVISGFAGSGKDTMANHLVSNHGFVKTSFAEPLKEMARIAFDFTDEQLYGPSAEREKPDERYPFSGICLRCQERCDFRPEQNRDMPWRCPSCDINYPTHITPRLALKTLGSEWGRTLYPNIWVDAALNRIQQHDEKNWTIPDLRFRNELECVHKVGGKVVRLRRGKCRSSHISEAEMLTLDDSEFDAIINNMGTVNEFYELIDTVMVGLRSL